MSSSRRGHFPTIVAEICALLASHGLHDIDRTAVAALVEHHRRRLIVATFDANTRGGEEPTTVAAVAAALQAPMRTEDTSPPCYAFSEPW